MEVYETEVSTADGTARRTQTRELSYVDMCTRLRVAWKPRVYCAPRLRVQVWESLSCTPLLVCLPCVPCLCASLVFLSLLCALLVFLACVPNIAWRQPLHLHPRRLKLDPFVAQSSDRLASLTQLGYARRKPLGKKAQLRTTRERAHGDSSMVQNMAFHHPCKRACTYLDS